MQRRLAPFVPAKAGTQDDESKRLVRESGFPLERL